MSDVAQNILEQLSGRGLFMLGCKEATAHKDGVSFKIGKNHRAINHIKVMLNGRDLYDVTFSRVPSRRRLERGAEATVVEEFEDVFCGSLKEVIERVTGMYMSLT